MSHTEEEAESLWCPEVRFSINQRNFTSFNRGGEYKGITNCLGSKCMAWRWLYWEGKRSSRGYCGKAGKP